MGLRADLHSELQVKLVPLLLQLGFEQIDLDTGETRLKRHFPLGRFRRIRNEVYHLVEVQFDKHGKPKFVVNFDIVPIDQQKSLRPFAGRLYARVFLMRWFGPSWFERLFQKADLATRIVQEMLDSFPEVELWFEKKQSGPHLKLWPG